MLKSIVLLSIVSYCQASYYGGHHIEYGNEYGHDWQIDDSYDSHDSYDSYEPSYGPSYGDSYGPSFGSYGHEAYHPIIKSHRNIEVRPMQTYQHPVHPQIIKVESLETPYKILYVTKSSPVHVEQVHKKGAPGHVEKTKSEEEPHKVYHEVVRPVIQEIREIIQPYRRVVQKIEPVIEEIKTVVAKGQPRHQSYGTQSYGTQSYNSESYGSRSESYDESQSYGSRIGVSGSGLYGKGLELNKGMTLGAVYRAAAKSAKEA